MRAFLASREKVNLVLLFLATFGALLCMYLWYNKLAGSNVICTSGCDVVLSSKYAQILQIPLEVYGLGFYIGFMVLTFQRLQIVAPLLDKMLAAHLIFGVLFSLYLRYIEFFEIGKICQLCWVSFIIILISSALLFTNMRLAKAKEPMSDK